MKQGFSLRAELFLEGMGLILAGYLLGILLQMIFVKFHPTAGVVEGVKVHTTGYIVERQAVLEKGGIPEELSIFVNNLLSVGVIMAFSRLSFRITGDRSFSYRTMPRIALFFIGFAALSLPSPLHSGGLFFLVYLLPHGVFELSAFALGYTAVRLELRDRLLIFLSLVLLIPASIIEANYSLRIAHSMFM